MPGSSPGKGTYGCIVAGVARSCIAAIAQPDSRGLDPGIHALAAEITKAQEDVDAHGSSPWAEGPRVEPGHGDLLRIVADNRFPSTGQPWPCAGPSRKLAEFVPRVVDAHGSSPWAEGPRDRPGHDGWSASCVCIWALARGREPPNRPAKKSRRWQFGLSFRLGSRARIG